ncbi:ABC transporter permease [Planctomycetota bacterium]
MRISDYIKQSLLNLRKKRLRTFLTTFGVVIGIGALVSMFSFGKGVQKNVLDRFKEMELLNYVTVFAESEEPQRGPHSLEPEPLKEIPSTVRILDDEFIKEVTRMKGVESAFPEERFPGQLRFNEEERFSLIQVLPAEVCQSELMELRAGRAYTSEEEDALIISDSLLRRMEITETQSVIGSEIEISTLKVDFGLLNPGQLSTDPQREGFPLSSESYTFTIVGVAERMGMGGPMPLRSDVFIGPRAARRMKKVSLTSIWDFFQTAEQMQGYPAVNIKVSSVQYIEPVKVQMEKWGLRSFALIDQLEEFKRGFLFMDMFLAAVGMIAIVVASLGIVNTMVMSIMERYKEIGIMKAVGASDADVKKIFFFESGVIGFLGGIFGLGLGWGVSMIINQVVNYFLARQGVPYTNYFNYPWWLCGGAVLFAIGVSLAAGIYPTIRAARVDPVVALRHD